MDPLSLTTSTSPAIVSNQTQQAQQNQQAEQTKPQSRSRPTSLPLLTRNQAQLTTPDGPPKPKELSNDQLPWGGSETKDTTALVPDEDKSTIKYATQTALNSDPLTASDLSRVRQANHATDKARRAITMIGNVSRYIRQTNGENIIRTEVGEEYANRDNEPITAQGNKIYSNAKSEESKKELLAGQELKKIIQTENTNRAAYATLAKSGLCQDFAYTTTREIAGKKMPGDTVETVNSEVPGVGHAFTTVTPPENSGKSKIIADAWMQGPAHRENDSLNMHKGSKRAIETFSSEENKAKLHQSYNSKVDSANQEQKYSRLLNMGPSMEDIIADRVANNTSFFHNEPSLDRKGNFNNVYNEAQSLSPEFRDGARSAAIEAGRLEGPRQLGKALVTTTDIYEGPLKEGELQPRSKFPEEHVNDMIPVLAKELAIPVEDRGAIDNLANHVSGVVRREAMKSESVPLTNDFDKWVNNS
jgi:hypothetical protein